MPRPARAEPASTQPSQPAAPPPLVAPELTAHEDPAYPSGAKGTGDVVVDVIVEPDGSVSHVTVVSREPAGEQGAPFADAAVAAVQRYRFTPARRGDRAVRAKIRIAVSFTPPPEPPPPSTEAPAATAPAAHGAPAAAPVEEVRVRGLRETQTPTEERLGRAEIRVVPGAFGDPYRAIDTLPGVVPIVSGLPYFYVRGAPPSAVGYYVDEVRVPYLFHFAFGPGVIQPALIEEVSLHPAAFPARYGRYAGGIVAGQLREPPTELHGEAQIRIFDAGAYAEAPFANGRATAGIGGRYSYTAGIISLVAPDLTIDYRDYNARASYRISDHWRASMVAFGSYDYASDKEDGVEHVVFASEFHRVDLRLDRRGDAGETTRIAATLGIDRTRIEASRFAQTLLAGVRARHTWPVTHTLDFEIGADVLTERTTGDLPSPYSVSAEDYEQASTLFAPRVDTASGAWISATVHPKPGWQVTATARGDVFTSADHAAFGPSPRVAVRVPVTRKIAFLSAMGIAPQPPAFAIPVPAVGYRGLPGGLAFAYQKSAGGEIALPYRFTFRAIGFHHSYFNLRDFSRDRSNADVTRPPPPPGSPTQAYGVETLLSRKLSERYSAFSSLTIMRAQLGSTTTEPGSVSPFDRTYVFQLGGIADLGRGWRTSLRFLTYRGWPVAQSSAEAQTTGDRLPPFRRLDLRIEKRWTFQKDRWIAAVLEGLNVTATKEVLGRTCDSNGVCKDDAIGPIVVPSLGVEGGL